MRLFFFLKAFAYVFIACEVFARQGLYGMPIQMFCADLRKANRRIGVSFY